jgi:hypothetical protein
MPVKGSAIRELTDISEDRRFFAADGNTYKNLYELYRALDRMTQEVFDSHVTVYKNDFSKWIRDIFLDFRLSKDLGNASSPRKAAEIVKKRIAYLEKNL